MQRRTSRGAFLAVLLLLGAAADALPSQKPNVVVLVLDQLRADRLHCYGNPRLTSPNIDRLADRGVRFANYFTVASWTSPSFGSLHSSLYPSRHGVTLFWQPGMPLLNKDVPTWAEDFKDHGYYTAAWVDNALAGKDLTGWGFDEYHEDYEMAVNITQRLGLGANAIYIAPTTTREVLTWLQHRPEQPFFLYIHFWEPHSPYNPPPKDDIFKSDAYPYMSDTGYDVQHGALLRLAMLGDQKAIERLYQLYDGKIHFADRYVGKVLAQLKAARLDDNTYVLLTSDHGELMFSHPEDFLTADHRSLYDADLRIPFIVAGPGLPRGRVVQALGENVDSAPTILDLAGLPPLSDAEGKSLVPLMKGEKSSIDDYIYSEEDVAIPERCIRSERYKLILNLWTGKEQLFDLHRDPGELHNVAAQNPAVLTNLDTRLRTWMRANQPSRQVQLRRWRIYTQPERVITVDDQTIGGRFLITGGHWRSDTSPQSGNFAVGCFWTDGGDGSRTAVWKNDDPMIGTYDIYVYYGHPPVGTLATNAPFTMVTDTGSQTVQVNLNEHGGEWLPLGRCVNPRYVRLTNAANGAVIADAVRFVRVN